MIDVTLTEVTLGVDNIVELINNGVDATIADELNGVVKVVDKITTLESTI